MAIPPGFETFYVGVMGGQAFHLWRCPHCGFETKPSLRRITGGKGRLKHFKESPECEVAT